MLSGPCCCGVFRGAAWSRFSGAARSPRGRSSNGGPEKINNEMKEKNLHQPKHEMKRHSQKKSGKKKPRRAGNEPETHRSSTAAQQHSSKDKITTDNDAPKSVNSTWRRPVLPLFFFLLSLRRWEIFGGRSHWKLRKKNETKKESSLFTQKEKKRKEYYKGTKAGARYLFLNHRTPFADH